MCLLFKQMSKRKKYKIDNDLVDRILSLDSPDVSSDSDREGENKENRQKRQEREDDAIERIDAALQRPVPKPGWQTLPTELWCIIASNIHCVYDRAELSVTCHALRSVVSDLSPPAPIPAFRCYLERLSILDTTRGYMENRSRKTFLWDSLVAMKDFVTKDLDDGKFYQNHFLELVLEWIKNIEPSDSVVDSVWSSVAYMHLSEQRLTATANDMIVELTRELSRVYRHRLVYWRRFKLSTDNPWINSKAMYSYKTIKLTEYDYLSLFERVNEVGHAVIDLPHPHADEEESSLSPCSIRRTINDGWINHQRSKQYFTLALESGYYVIRASTIEEVHEHCIRDCEDMTQCCTNLGIPKNPVVFYYAMLPGKTRDPWFAGGANDWHFYHCSLFFNKKEAVDQIIEKRTSFIKSKVQAGEYGLYDMIDSMKGIRFRVITLK